MVHKRNSSITEQLRHAFDAYLQAYFVLRQPQATFELFSPTLTGFGTGRDEEGFAPSDFEKLYRRDFSQAPNPVEYAIEQIHIQPLDENNGVVQAVLDLRTDILHQTVQLNHARLSVVFHLEGKQWLIAHMHISFPTEAHDGDESYPVKELEERTVVLENLVKERTRELEEARKKLETLAVTDAMTGLFNRLKLEQQLDHEIQRAKRYQNCFSIILFDLDHFKSVNDLHGHLNGDQVLAVIANLLQSRMRSTDILGRWGGDEFLVISPETTLKDAVLLAETIRISVASHDFQENGRMTTSCGVTSWQPNDSLQTLMERVDRALYQAKADGKNLVVS